MVGAAFGVRAMAAGERRQANMHRMAWALMVVVAVLGGLATGCNVGIGECHGDNGAPVVSGTGTGGAGGQRIDVGAGGFNPFDGGGGGNKPLSYQPIACAGPSQPFPPPAPPDGEHLILQIPDASVLYQIRAKVTPPNGHTAPPEALPVLEFIDAPTGPANIGKTAWAATVRDNPGSLAEYEQPHFITLDIVPQAGGLPVDNSVYTLSMIAIPEQGIGAVEGSTFNDFVCYVLTPPGG